MSESKEKKYIEAIGRRKTAIARARLTPSTKSSFEVNNQAVDSYFKVAEQKAMAVAPIGESKLEKKFEITVLVKGGGMNAQAEAVRHAVARALVDFDQELRKGLKKAGYLKRDARAKERRKFGLKKARKAPQWSKR